MISSNAATLTIGRDQLEKIILAAVKHSTNIQLDPSLSLDMKHAAMIILGLSEILKEHSVEVNFELDKQGVIK